MTRPQPRRSRRVLFERGSSRGTKLRERASPVSPVEGLREEAGGGADPAAVAVQRGCGPGDGAAQVLLGALLLLLGQVVRQGAVLLHLHVRRVQRDEDLGGGGERLDHNVDLADIVQITLTLTCQSFFIIPKTKRETHLFSSLVLDHLLGCQHLGFGDG